MLSVMGPTKFLGSQSDSGAVLPNNVGYRILAGGLSNDEFHLWRVVSLVWLLRSAHTVSLLVTQPRLFQNPATFLKRIVAWRSAKGIHNFNHKNFLSKSQICWNGARSRASRPVFLPTPSWKVSPTRNRNLVLAILGFPVSAAGTLWCWSFPFTCSCVELTGYNIPGGARESIVVNGFRTTNLPEIWDVLTC